MIKTIDIARDLATLALLEGRGEHTTEAEAQASFARLGEFRDGGIFAAHFSGCSGWERHPKGDEIVQILEGAVSFEIIVADEWQTLDLEAGMMVVVPQNCWHRFTSEAGVKVLTATRSPRPTATSTTRG